MMSNAGVYNTTYSLEKKVQTMKADIKDLCKKFSVAGEKKSKKQKAKIIELCGKCIKLIEERIANLKTSIKKREEELRETPPTSIEWSAMLKEEIEALNLEISSAHDEFGWISGILDQVTQPKSIVSDSGYPQAPQPAWSGASSY